MAVIVAGAFATVNSAHAVPVPPDRDRLAGLFADAFEGVLEGEAAAKAWLEGIQANEPKVYEGNEEVLNAIAAGEIEVGFVNHYYRFEVAAEDGEIPVDNHFFTGGDPGALVNAAGAGTPAQRGSRYLPT